MSKKKKNKNMKEKEFNPDVDTGIGRPVRASIAIGDPNDKYSTYPSNGLTPRRLARIFRAADEGDVREQMEMFEEMEEKDTHLFSQLQTRKLAVTGLDWEVQPFSDDERDKTIAEFIRDQLKNIEKFDDILMDLLDAIGKGISVMEIEWGVKEGHNVIEDITYVHPKKLIWDSLTDEMKICTKEFPSGVAFPENKFVIHRYKAKSGHESRNGVLRVGLPETATIEDVRKALTEALKKPSTDGNEVVANSTVLSLLSLNEDARTEDVVASIMALKAGNTDVAAELLELKNQLAEKEADELVNMALKDGKISAAQTEWAKQYALSDKKGFKSFMEKAPVVVNMEKMDLKDAPDKKDSEDFDMEILKNMGISEEDYKNYYKQEEK